MNISDTTGIRSWLSDFVFRATIHYTKRKLILYVWDLSFFSSFQYNSSHQHFLDDICKSSQSFHAVKPSSTRLGRVTRDLWQGTRWKNLPCFKSGSKLSFNNCMYLKLFKSSCVVTNFYKALLFIYPHSIRHYPKFYCFFLYKLGRFIFL